MGCLMNHRHQPFPVKTTLMMKTTFKWNAMIKRTALFHFVHIHFHLFQLITSPINRFILNYCWLVGWLVGSLGIQTEPKLVKLKRALFVNYLTLPQFCLLDSSTSPQIPNFQSSQPQHTKIKQYFDLPKQQRLLWNLIALPPLPKPSRPRVKMYFDQFPWYGANDFFTHHIATAVLDCRPVLDQFLWSLILIFNAIHKILGIFGEFLSFSIVDHLEASKKMHPQLEWFFSNVGFQWHQLMSWACITEPLSSQGKDEERKRLPTWFSFSSSPSLFNSFSFLFLPSDNVSIFFPLLSLGDYVFFNGYPSFCPHKLTSVLFHAYISLCTTFWIMGIIVELNDD